MEAVCMQLIAEENDDEDRKQIHLMGQIEPQVEVKEKERNGQKYKSSTLHHLIEKSNETKKYSENIRTNSPVQKQLQK